MMAKILIAYFSATGVTEKVAKELAKTENADLYQICPEVPYSAADLDWTNKESRSTVEMHDLNCRPAICGQVQNMDQHDVVFVGFPIWWESFWSKFSQAIPVCSTVLLMVRHRSLSTLF